jgi:hypothetical protein
VTVLTSSDPSLLDVRDEIRSRIKILYDDSPVQDVHLAVIALFNSGSIPIVSSDYEHPVEFNFGDMAVILSSEITRTIPPNLPARINTQSNKITFDPTLLNPGDLIAIKVLASGIDGQITVSARIQGVKEISEDVAAKKRAYYRRGFKLNLSAACLTLIIFPLTTTELVGTVSGWLVAIVCSLFLFAFLTLLDYVILKFIK